MCHRFSTDIFFATLGCWKHIQYDYELTILHYIRARTDVNGRLCIKLFTKHHSMRCWRANPQQPILNQQDFISYKYLHCKINLTGSQMQISDARCNIRIVRFYFKQAHFRAKQNRPGKINILYGNQPGSDRFSRGTFIKILRSASQCVK